MEAEKETTTSFRMIQGLLGGSAFPFRRNSRNSLRMRCLRFVEVRGFF